MICGVGHRRGWDPVLLRLWPRLAAVALIEHLAWESPYAMGAQYLVFITLCHYTLSGFHICKMGIINNNSVYLRIALKIK